MSVLIKGMEMPKNCYECLFAMRHYSPLFGSIHLNKKFEYDYSCIITQKTITSTRRNRFCPLVEVPTPHGRLIDADELREKMIKEADTYIPYVQNDIRHGYHNCELLVDDAPTIIESED